MFHLTYVRGTIYCNYENDGKLQSFSIPFTEKMPTLCQAYSPTTLQKYLLHLPGS